MRRTVYFNNCLREIRYTVYGRDMRKPTADAIDLIRNDASYVDRSAWMEELTERIEAIPHNIITDVDVEGPGIIGYITVYEQIMVDDPDNYHMNGLNGHLSVTQVVSDDYSVTNSGSSESAYISGDNYLWMISGNDAESENDQIEITVSHEEPVYNDDYSLVLNVKG